MALGPGENGSETAGREALSGAYIHSLLMCWLLTRARPSMWHTLGEGRHGHTRDIVLSPPRDDNDREEREQGCRAAECGEGRGSLGGHRACGGACRGSHGLHLDQRRVLAHAPLLRCQGHELVVRALLHQPGARREPSGNKMIKNRRIARQKVPREEHTHKLQGSLGTSGLCCNPRQAGEPVACPWRPTQMGPPGRAEQEDGRQQEKHDSLALGDHGNGASLADG